MRKVAFSFIYDRPFNGHLDTARACSWPLELGTLFDEDITYEEIVKKLLEDRRLLPLYEPRLRYNLVLEVFEITYYSDPAIIPSKKDLGVRRKCRSLSQAVTLREGQTLASTHLIPLYRKAKEALERHPHFNDNIVVYCAISIEIKPSPPPKEKPDSTSPSLGETITTALTSREATAIANFITVATGLMACIGVLRLVVKQWSKKHDVDGVSSQGYSSQPSETDIVAIRLRMTHGPDHEFEEWLTTPDRLKHYIDVFNEPSSSIQPLYAIFIQRNGRALKADVLAGTQNNLQLNELLSYLNIGSEEK